MPSLQVSELSDPLSLSCWELCPQSFRAMLSRNVASGLVTSC